MEAIVAFLTARLDEDEAETRRLLDQPPMEFRHKGIAVESWSNPDYSDEGISLSPERMLAEIASKRVILALHPNVNDGDCGLCAHGPVFGGRNPSVWPCETVLALAQPYSGHHDFDQRWILPSMR